MISVTNLRKIFTAQGIKGAGKWNREIFNSVIAQAWDAALQMEEARKPVAEPKAKKGSCSDCGRPEAFRGCELCEDCNSYAEWENTHSDHGHATLIESGKAVTRDLADEIAECPVCHPELDPRKLRRAGRSRAGMVIIAKGTEVHKSETFRVAAEAAGWTVSVLSETYELPEDAEGEGTRYYATATRGEDSISLAWDGRRYDYPASSARINGKDRKIRNLKEALRVLAA